MSAKTKLELTWIGKEHRPRLEPRILIEHDVHSHHAAKRRGADQFDNVLIHGDNLLAIKALEAQYVGQIKCIYIDPPYNTGSAFAQYDDGLEHSYWLSLFRDRLFLLKELLREDGTIWVHLDDNEAHYAKVLMDEVFGRSNFVANVVWQKRTSPDARVVLGAGHDHILVYAKSIARVSLKRIPKSEQQRASYKNPDNDPRGPWVSSDYTAQGFRPNQVYTIRTPGGAEYTPPAGNCWKNIEAVFLDLVADNRIWFGKDGKGVPRRKTFLSESEGTTPWTWWTNAETGHTQEAKKESIELFGSANVFDTPKPERLIQRVLEIATDAGDLVLDSFAGSGTTGAVAHKMGRPWIMVELGDHCETHIVPRLKKVIDGNDPGGITKQVDWKGGGGYRYFRLAPSLLEKDQFGQWVISKAYNAEMLAEAMCKHFGFTYAPSTEHYWMHGHSSEADFIYVTTNSLTHEQLRTISEEVGDERTLLICCKAFQGANADGFTNLTIRKIPGAILDRCEWGKDDYSLKIEALPLIEDEPVEEEPGAASKASGRAKADNQPALFDVEGEA